MKAVILAGGRGTRLRPFTTHFPKALMPVGTQPILQTVIASLHQAGIDDIILATGHHEGLIRAFFGDGGALGVQISYSNEKEPLGTAGPLNLIRDALDETFLVMNADVLSDVDFGDLIESHRAASSSATVVVADRQVNIDFGVVAVSSSGHFEGWTEKPTIDYLVSAGMYLFEPAALDSLPQDGRIDLPDFVTALHQRGEPLNVYRHSGYWLDIGRPEDYEKACRDFAELSPASD